MNKLDVIVGRLQLKIFAEQYKNPNPDNNRIETYTEVIHLINQECNESYEIMPPIINERTLANEFPIRRAKS